MVIEESDFRIIPSSSLFYDVEVLYVVNKGKPNEKTQFKNIAYGVSFEKAIKLIIRHKLDNKEETVSLKQYLEEYKQIKKEIEDLCKI